MDRTPKDDNSPRMSFKEEEETPQTSYKKKTSDNFLNDIRNLETLLNVVPQECVDLVCDEIKLGKGKIGYVTNYGDKKCTVVLTEDPRVKVPNRIQPDLNCKGKYKRCNSQAKSVKGEILWVNPVGSPKDGIKFQITYLFMIHYGRRQELKYVLEQNKLHQMNLIDLKYQRWDLSHYCHVNNIKKEPNGPTCILNEDMGVEPHGDNINRKGCTGALCCPNCKYSFPCLHTSPSVERDKRLPPIKRCKPINSEFFVINNKNTIIFVMILIYVILMIIKR